MQVISGNIKGLKLESNKNENLRPTKDRIKKSLFDVLRFNIKEKVFLDLFGGTGQIGIEAFSQGAKEVFIVEQEKENSLLIKKNLQKIKRPHNIKLFNQDALNFLENIKTNFDIIFLDPPYKNLDLLEKCLRKICKLPQLPEIIAIETLSEQKIYIDEKNFCLRKKYIYGKISLNLYEKF